MIENNSLRVTGLASGMNTDEIVSNLVKVQSARLNKLTQNKTLADWKTDTYRDVNKKIDEFRKSMENLRLQSTFNKQAVISSDSKVEVQMGGTSTLTDFTISNVTLASSAKPAMVSFSSGAANVAEDMTFNLNTIDIALTKDMTFDQAIAEINKHSTNTKVKAANVGGSLVLTSTDSTSPINLTLTGTTTSDNSLKLTTNPLPIEATPARLGSVTINGSKIEGISSNKFTYEGVTFTLKEPFTGSVSVQVSSDTQGIFDSIKTFVDKYNELIADLNGRLTEKKYRDYPPLLDEQKKDLKENEIKLWEEKAKSGLLTNDATIQTFLTEMRNSLGSVIENSTGFKSLKDIGINFSNNYQDKGKLVLDEAKLKGVLQTNLEDVKKLFTFKGGDSTSSSTTVTDRTKHNESGFAWRIYDRVNLTISQLGTLAGSPNTSVDTKSFMAKQIKALDENISREERKVSAYEARLWKQFGAMEKALQQLNSQGSWLSQQLGM
ncbi:flagellar filament capping protein FliD [Neobacillus sp. YX16]|uniref:flagellar filament capping protein FliD n=1 Tax=Neobacillus sp. YX16 TaxID=3047874 RepID=UPI0024C41A57|nr:flagellar filament capping protein FliD [Neobacillus sp. YX16]WHZ05396.1 flagellar filament capping protein FliD [Neobacillus sp. YX16]